ncbi:TPA: arginine--tRNA ligase [Candidatus Poribacteria bacterium]|nr:arginine--tRNA ligase [Candidatus Poribacteria bacterium]
MLKNNGNILASIREELKNIVLTAVNKAIEAKLIGSLDIPEFNVQKPDQREYGDFSVSLPLMLTKQAKMPPKQIAEAIVQFIDERDIIDKVEIAGPGFINFFLKHEWLNEILLSIQEMGKDYGKTNIGAGEKVQVEFVSANPVGPLNVVSARAASVGDSIVNLLNAIGYDAKREFYVNDAGGQVFTFARSINARYLQLLGKDVPFPEDGYHGDYVKDLAREIIDEYGDKFLNIAEEERLETFRNIGLKKILDGQKQDLRDFGVEFDLWASEKAVRDSGKMDVVLNIIHENQYSYKKDGAIWFKSTFFGDDRDRVIVKSNGEVTYIVPDLAYHLDKSERGFKKVIDLWGPDHHGYIPRMKSGMQALGLPYDWLEILIVQQVNLLRGGEAVRMSKRAGQFVTLKQLIDELSEQVGRQFAVDVARFFFLMRSTNAHLDFDMDLAVQQAESNPVFYVQYAHARICSIFKQKEEKGIKTIKNADLSLLKEPEEVDLIKKLADFPDTVYDSAINMTPHTITKYVQELAAVFHSFYNKCKVLDSDNIELSNARLVLVDCVRTVIKNGLALLGISAPEAM